MLQDIYEPLNAEWDKKIKECCDKPDGEIPPGDCCYDNWTAELKEVNKAYQQAEEEAKQKSAEFTYVSERRDQFKKWYDELTKANELEKAICDQLDVFFCQVQKVGINTQFTVDAVKILFCMIREYYLQLDKLKEKYDALIDCIKCLNSPGLTPGAGLMKLIEDYGVKLAAAQASRDELLKLIIAALGMAEKIDLNIGPDYGLQTVVNQWKDVLNCCEECGAASEQEKKKPEAKQGIQSADDDCADEDCKLKPMLKMPICNDPYYGQTYEKYQKDDADAKQLAKDLLALNKKKESLQACKQSLELAIKEVDPKTRCK